MAPIKMARASRSPVRAGRVRTTRGPADVLTGVRASTVDAVNMFGARDGLAELPKWLWMLHNMTYA
jgi:hypothetical protein